LLPRAAIDVAKATVTATAAMTMSPTTSKMIWSADTHYPVPFSASRGRRSLRGEADGHH
jgi:hypothetical protein